MSAHCGGEVERTDRLIYFSREGCPLLAHSRQRLLHCTCPLLGAKRTWCGHAKSVENEPKQRVRLVTAAVQAFTLERLARPRPSSLASMTAKWISRQQPGEKRCPTASCTTKATVVCRIASIAAAFPTGWKKSRRAQSSAITRR